MSEQKPETQKRGPGGARDKEKRKNPSRARRFFLKRLRAFLQANYSVQARLTLEGLDMYNGATNFFNNDGEWTRMSEKEKWYQLGEMQNRRRSEKTPKGLAKKEKRKIAQRKRRNACLFPFTFDI
jgi:hypothetical protein